MKKVNVKRMIALGTSLAMVGATIFGASAVNLADFPAPFIVDGTPASNLAVIVGDAADGSDVVGAIDIIQRLQTSAVVKTPLTGRGGGGVIVEGDAVEIGSTSDLLEINETIGDVRETLTEVDLDMLKGGQLTTDEGSTEFNQYLRFNTTETLTGGRVVFAEDERDRVGHYLFWDDGQMIFEWELEFEEGLESEIKGDDLEDLEDEDLIVLGQPYVIVDTDFTNTTDDLKIEFMGGSVSGILGENDKETYVVDGKEYEVEVVVISETAKGGEGAVKFRVNGEITDELEDGETDVLADGTQMGIRDILATGKDIQKSIVQFYLGAYKLEFEDLRINETTYRPGGAEINEETIEDGEVIIRGSQVDDDHVEISFVRYRLFADAVLGDMYVPPGSGIREQMDEPEGMLAPTWDIRYEGLMDTGVTIIRIDSAGDDEYDLEFTNQEGIFYDFPLAGNEAGVFKWGDDDDDLWFVESANTSANFKIKDDDYFVLSDCTATDNTCFTHILRYDSVDTSNRQLTFTDLGTGTREVTFDNSTRLAELVVGGITYNVYVATTTPFNLSIDLNGDGDIAHDQVFIATLGEALIDLGNTQNQTNGTISVPGPSQSEINISIRTLAREFDEAPVDGERIRIAIENRTSNEIGIDTGLFGTIGGNGTLFGLIDLEENEDLSQALSGYGVFFELFDPTTSDEAEDMTIEYPLSQRGARVFVTGGAVTTKEFEGDMAERVHPIQIGAAKLASEVSDVTQYNSAIIGGACANPIAAQLQGNPEPCWESVPENKAIIKLYEHANGNVALLVAGRTAMNTRQGSRAVATGRLANVAGKEAEVSGTSLTDVTVRAV